MSSGTLGPKAFIRSKKISQAVSISSWPVKKPSRREEKNVARRFREMDLHDGDKRCIEVI